MSSKKTIMQFAKEPPLPRVPSAKIILGERVPPVASKDPAGSINHAETLLIDEVENASSRPSMDPDSAARLKSVTVLPSAQLEGGEVRWIHTAKSRLEVMRQIGEGGAGEVVVAMDHDIGRMVAIKKIRSEVMSEHMILRFIEEIRTVGKLEHPNIIPIHDVGVDEMGDYYFVMKYVEGETLDAIIERLKKKDPATTRQYPFERRIELFRGLLEAMAYAHSKGIIHRDIKPENVMVGPFGEVLLMDWGIARPIDTSEMTTTLDNNGETDAVNPRFWQTADGGIIGTPAYMSPEQASGKKLDERSDIYSLSVLLHELLTLNHYLDNKEDLNDVLEGAINDNPGIISYEMVNPPVPMELVWYVRKGMQKAPSNRYQNVTEMIHRLEKRAEGVVPVECPITFAKRVNGSMMSFTDRHPMLGSMVLMIFAGLGIYGAIAVIFNSLH